MRRLILFFVLLLSMSGRGQVDTLYANRWQAADTAFGQLGQFVTTGFLGNRAHLETGILPVYKASDTLLASADLYYGLIEELKYMALDSSEIPSLYQLYLDASRYVADFEFEEDRYVYPMGIIDYRYNELDVDWGINQGFLVKSGYQYLDAGGNGAAYSEHTTRMVAPLFDYFNTVNLSIIFRQEDFRSNYRDVNEITSIEVKQSGNWIQLGFGQEYQVTIMDSTRQYLTARITYTDGSTFVQDIMINTPEIPEEIASTKSQVDCDEGTISHGLLKIKWCRIKACNSEVPIQKPYILLTGYRPPQFGQSFEKTWAYYNDEQMGILDDFVAEGYDVFLVKFNMDSHPQTLGLSEAADLLIDFLKYVNNNKVTDYENVISASSMSSDIARLALLKMESWNEFIPNFKHHHCRLVIHYDGNIWGANLAYCSLIQAYSGYLSPSMFTIDLQTTYLRTFLFAAMEQKATKELLMYHPAASINSAEYFSPILTKTVIPTAHPYRLDFYNQLYMYENALTNTAINNHQYITPMSRAPRHVAISLGKFKDENNVNQNGTNFIAPGDLWVSGTDHIFRAAKYSTSPELLFRRQVIKPWFTMASHNIYVKEMLPIDNASGSYLSNIGNILFMTILTYRNEFTLPVPSIYILNDPLFSHKSVVTALAINPNLWEPLHTMTLDMQSLGLMYDQYNAQNQSNNFGYPHIGRPNDHFSITPFEAIYVDDQPDLHIRLNNSAYVAELVQFIRSEVEPYDLYLQNQRVGAQVLPPQVYRIKRQAALSLTSGYHVTPQTDPGDYIVEANGIANLQAGESVNLMPGTEFKPGSDVWVHILYESCEGGGKAPESNQVHLNDPGYYAEDSAERSAAISTDKSDEVLLYPNPSKGFITIACDENSTLQSIEISTISGNLVYRCADLEGQQHEVPMQLDKGTYVLRIRLNDGLSHLKLVVL